jgi:hypothetical protein
MGGNVLDMQMAKGKPAVIESRTYEPGEYPDPDAPGSEPGLFDPAFVPGRHEHPATAPTSREQVKARAREALLTHGGWGEWRDNQPARGGASIAREQNAGLRDAYVVRLDGAPQFTTYDVEEALDIFAGMVTGERARNLSAIDSGPLQYGRPVANEEEMVAKFGPAQSVVVGPDGRKHAVKIPSQADLDAARNPDPAPGHVWMPPADEWSTGHRSPNADGTVTVKDATPPLVSFEEYGVGSALPLRMQSGEDGWRCLGVETPHGRVMVGDEFVTDNGWAFTIAGIVDGDHLVRRFPDGSTDRHTRACYLLDKGSTARRTRYATAREGERYRWRTTGQVATVAEGAVGTRHEASKGSASTRGRRSA